MVRRVALYHRVSRAFFLAGSLGYRHLALLYRPVCEWPHAVMRGARIYFEAYIFYA